MAINPILAQLTNATTNQTTQANSPFAMLAQIKQSSNPKELIESMPGYQNAMAYVNQNGGNARTAFYNLAAQKGVNPNDILGQIK